MKWDAKLLNWPFVTRQKEKKKKKNTQPSLCERQPMIVRRAILPLFFHQCGGLWHPTRQQFQLKLLSCPIPVDCRLAAFFLNKISFIIVLFKSWDSTSFFYFIYRHLSMNSKNEKTDQCSKRDSIAATTGRLAVGHHWARAMEPKNCGIGGISMHSADSNKK